MAVEPPGGTVKIRSKQLFVAASAIMITLSGCGGEGDPIDLPSETTTSVSSTPDGKSDGNGKNGKQKKKEQPDDELAWVPFGPGSPGGDQYEQYYSALQRRECSGVGSESPVSEDGYEVLYHGLRQACVVLFESGDASLWESARQDLDRAIGLLAGEDLDCTEDAALALAKQIRAFDDPPKVSFPSTGTTACEWGVEAVVLADNEDAASGPLEGGTPVKIKGTRMTGATKVYFGDQEVLLNPDEISANEIVVASPPADAPGFVRIKVVSPGGTRLSPEGVGFTYVDGDEGGTDPSPSPSETIEEQE